MLKTKDKQRAYKDHSDSSLEPTKPTESRGRHTHSLLTTMVLSSIHSGNRHRFGAMRMDCTQKLEGRVTMRLKYGGEVTPLF